MILGLLGRKRLNLFLLLFISIVGFGLLLVSRFYATDIRPATKVVDTNVEATQTETLEPTDKTELEQTDLIKVVEPSEQVKKAERAMPKQDEPSYVNACHSMKNMYTNERNEKLQKENKRLKEAQQKITNRYNHEGRSFSKAEKFAHSWEERRHEWAIKQINGQYKKQLKNLSC